MTSRDGRLEFAVWPERYPLPSVWCWHSWKQVPDSSVTTTSFWPTEITDFAAIPDGAEFVATGVAFHLLYLALLLGIPSAWLPLSKPKQAKTTGK